MPLSGVPLTMFGVPVGSAQINDDGTIALKMDSPCAFGKDLLKQFEQGVHSVLSLSPVGVVGPPVPSSDKAVVSNVVNTLTPQTATVQTPVRGEHGKSEAK